MIWNWRNKSEEVPNNINSVMNKCLVRTTNEQYFVAYWSVQLKMWRRIEIPHKFDRTKVIDELIKPDDIIAWIPFSEIK